MSSNFTNHFSADDAALVLIDFQPQMFMVGLLPRVCGVLAFI
jgi:hypothetical protein